MIPDTHNGPLYRAWKQMRDEEIAAELRAHRNSVEAEHATNEAVDLLAGKPKPDASIQSTVNPFQHIDEKIIAKMNGEPVTQPWMQRMTGYSTTSIAEATVRLLQSGRIKQLTLRSGNIPGTYLKLNQSERDMAHE